MMWQNGTDLLAGFSWEIQCDQSDITWADVMPPNVSFHDVTWCDLMWCDVIMWHDMTNYKISVTYSRTKINTDHHQQVKDAHTHSTHKPSVVLCSWAIFLLTSFYDVKMLEWGNLLKHQCTLMHLSKSQCSSSKISASFICYNLAQKYDVIQWYSVSVY